jgi:hypothetical protein
LVLDVDQSKLVPDFKPEAFHDSFSVNEYQAKPFYDSSFLTNASASPYPIATAESLYQNNLLHESFDSLRDDKGAFINY